MLRLDLLLVLSLESSQPLLICVEVGLVARGALSEWSATALCAEVGLVACLISWEQLATALLC